jgi:hypothetical protein
MGIRDSADGAALALAAERATEEVLTTGAENCGRSLDGVILQRTQYTFALGTMTNEEKQRV